MPVNVERGKSQAELDRQEHRQNNFYKQSVAENNARLLAKFPNNPDLRSELEFTQADMIIRGAP